MTGYITLDHGAGGLASQKLIGSLFLKYLKNPILGRMEDGAVFDPGEGRTAFTTDSYVVDPIFFPGGTIGELAVNGTINDLAMCGAEPRALSLALIIEEGFGIAELERIIKAIADSADHAGVPVLTGDTKVVPRGKADKIFINTSGIGMVGDGIRMGADRIRAGDVLLLSGTLADHGITIMTSRAGLTVDGNLQSDTRPLHFLSRKILTEAPESIHAMRDPTRGGLGTVLAELATTTNLCMEVEEENIPMRGEVRAACELMGLDPLYLANEGKCVVIAAPEQAASVLGAMQATEAGRQAAIIGKVTEKYPGRVILHTVSGGKRLVEPLSGEPLPRIC
jgi:hydrogenase expression/formation protein HypE